MGTMCDYCQNSPLYVFKDYVNPVPRPFPDYSALPAYHYLSHKETPISIDGETRPVDDFQSGVQLKKLLRLEKSLPTTNQLLKISVQNTL